MAEGNDWEPCRLGASCRLDGKPHEHKAANIWEIRLVA